MPEALRPYEVMIILDADLDEETIRAAVERWLVLIESGGAERGHVDWWGKRRLAYEIKHFREASYFLIHFDIAPSEVRGIERGILITEEILRHLVTVLEEKALGRADDEIPISDVAIPIPVTETDDLPPEGLGDEADDDVVAAEA